MLSDESAFGRPPKWSTAMPAILAGVFACMIAGYGRFALPARLPTQYAAHLQESSAEYESLSSGIGGFYASSRLIDVAGQQDVIFERIVALESGNPARYWEWSQYLSQHATLLSARLSDPAASIQDSLRDRYQQQIAQFESKSNEILEQLAVGESSLKDLAVLQLSRRKVEAGLSPMGMVGAATAAQRMEAVVRNAASPLSPDELDESKYLWVALTVESAWQQTVGSTLRYDLPTLEKAEVLLQEFTGDPKVQTERMIEWMALRALIQRYLGRDVDEAKPELESDSTIGWRKTMAEVSLAACDGRWRDVEYLLPSPNAPGANLVLNGSARTLCRLICCETGKKDPAWLEQQLPGLRLTGERSLQLPEWSELLWESARVLSSNNIGPTPESNPPGSKASSESPVPERVASELKALGDPLLEHTLIALQAALRSDFDVMKKELAVLSSIPGKCFWVSRVALWRAQGITADQSLDVGRNLERLMEEVVLVEPDSGLNWFALGILEFRLGELLKAEESLGKASELTSNAPGVRDALNAVKSARNARGIR